MKYSKSRIEKDMTKLLIRMKSENRYGYATNLSKLTKIPSLTIWRTIKDVRKMKMEEFLLISEAIGKVKKKQETK